MRFIWCGWSIEGLNSGKIEAKNKATNKAKNIIAQTSLNV
jgi:hypothetical protein